MVKGLKIELKDGNDVIIVTEEDGANIIYNEIENLIYENVDEEELDIEKFKDWYSSTTHNSVKVADIKEYYYI